MTNIKPISNSRYNTDILKEVYEPDCYDVAYPLFNILQKAEERASKEGWINAEDLEHELGV